MCGTLMQEGVGLRAKPNVVECGRGVASFYKLGETVEGRGGGLPVVAVRHQIIGRLREGRREDEIRFMRGENRGFDGASVT
jgi:hypothetical protein